MRDYAGRKGADDSAVKRHIKRSQEILRRHVPRGVSLADELIEERRAEAARERSEYGDIPPRSAAKGDRT